MKFRILEHEGKFIPQYQDSFMIFWKQWINCTHDRQPDTFDAAMREINDYKIWMAPKPKPIIHNIEPKTGMNEIKFHIEEIEICLECRMLDGKKQYYLSDQPEKFYDSAQEAIAHRELPAFDQTEEGLLKTRTLKPE